MDPDLRSKIRNRDKHSVVFCSERMAQAKGKQVEQKVNQAIKCRGGY